MRRVRGVTAGVVGLGVWCATWSGSAAGAPAADVDRAALVREVSGKWRDAAQARGYDPGRWQTELEQAGLGRSPQELLAARDAASYDEMLAALHIRSLAPKFGQDTNELVFFPLAPCRIVDTRFATGMYAGPIAAGTQRSFNHNFDLIAQGGTLASCGVPVDPTAIAVTLTAARTAGNGNLRAFAHTGTLPGASALNYALGANIANTTIVPTCQLCGEDFSIRADGAATDVIVDVVGYFWSPLRSALSCTTQTISGSIAAGSFLTLTTPACPAGSTLTGGGIDTNFLVAEIWVYSSTPNAARTAWTCSARSQHTAAWPFDCFATCCSTPGR